MRDKAFEMVFVWDSSWNWIVVALLGILIINSHYRIGSFMNAGMVFIALLIIAAIKIDAHH